MPVTGLIGRKLGMTQIFTQEGRWIPVTVVACGPCRIVQIRTRERDGYEAVQLGFQEAKEKHLNRPLLGHFRKAGVPGYRHLHEFRGPVEGLEVGQEITVSIFEKGDRVDVTGITKGKGFQGVIRRHGFQGGPASHGSMFHRAPGSIGSSSFPSRVFKNKRLPGHMGHVRRTVQNLEVVEVRREEHLLLVRGAVPGPRGAILWIRKSVKAGSREESQSA